MKSWIFFIAQKWIFPTHSLLLKKINNIAFMTVFLSSFLAFLLLGFINYFDFTIHHSFIAKDFHLHWKETDQTRTLWQKIKPDFEKTFSPLGDFKYGVMDSILYFHQQKLPLEIQAIPSEYEHFIHFPLKEGLFVPEIPSILLNQEIMNIGGIRRGDIVSIYLSTSQEKGKSIHAIRLKVTGILDESRFQQKTFLAIVPFEILSPYFTHYLYHGLLLKDPKQLNKAQYYLSSQFHFFVNTYEDLHSNLLYSLKWEKIFFFFILGLIIVISFVIIYLGFQIISYKNKENFIILRILGAPFHILTTVSFYQSLWIGIKGTFISFFLVLLIYQQIIPLFFLWVRKVYHNNFFVKDIVIFFQTSVIFHFHDILFTIMIEFFAIFISIVLPSLKIRKTPLYEVLKNE